MTANDGPIVEDDLQAYVDGRLRRGAARRGRGLSGAESRACASASRSSSRQRNALRGQLEGKFAEPMPPRLRIANIQAARRTAMAAAAGGHRGGLLIFAVGAGTGWFAEPHHEPLHAAAPATDDASRRTRRRPIAPSWSRWPIRSRSASAQEAHLLQWLSRRLGKPLAAPDLSPFGYRLMGGRLLPGNGSRSGAADVRRCQRQAADALRRAPPHGSETAFRFSATATPRPSPGSTRASASP